MFNLSDENKAKLHIFPSRYPYYKALKKLKLSTDFYQWQYIDIFNTGLYVAYFKIHYLDNGNKKSSDISALYSFIPTIKYCLKEAIASKYDFYRRDHIKEAEKRLLRTLEIYKSNIRVSVEFMDNLGIFNTFYETFKYYKKNRDYQHLKKTYPKEKGSLHEYDLCPSIKSLNFPEYLRSKSTKLMAKIEPYVSERANAMTKENLPQVETLTELIQSIVAIEESHENQHQEILAKANNEKVELLEKHKNDMEILTHHFETNLAEAEQRHKTELVEMHENIAKLQDMIDKTFQQNEQLLEAQTEQGKNYENNLFAVLQRLKNES